MLVVMMMMTMTTGRTAANAESEASGREGGCRKGSGAPRRRDIALTLGKHRQCSGADRRRIQSTECTECYFGPRRIVRPAVGDESTCRMTLFTTPPDSARHDDDGERSTNSRQSMGFYFVWQSGADLNGDNLRISSRPICLISDYCRVGLGLG